MKHKTTKEHYNKYAQMSKNLGISLKESTEPFFDKTRVTELYKEDPLLNNIPLELFDVYYYSLAAVNLNILSSIGCSSLAENCCMYKHLLIYEVLGLTPEFKGEN